MDTPFALRGYLAGTGSKYRMSHCSSFSLEHKTLMTIPNGSKISQPSMAPHGSRVFHGNQVRSASSKGAFLNRPLSPHLALKKPATAERNLLNLPSDLWSCSSWRDHVEPNCDEVQDPLRCMKGKADALDSSGRDTNLLRANSYLKYVTRKRFIRARQYDGIMLDDFQISIIDVLKP